MTAVVNVGEAKTHFSRLLERAHGGEEIVLAKAGKPYARLMPLAPSEERRSGQPSSASDGGVLSEAVLGDQHG